MARKVGLPPAAAILAKPAPPPHAPAPVAM